MVNKFPLNVGGHIPPLVPSLEHWDRTGQDKTGQDRTGQDRTGQDRTGQDKTVIYARKD